ncbi:MAG: Uncharacterized conserved protein, DUF58 family, contains vWF domain [Verrucomicrobia bacterium]|jgi:uncharacterized protein (DUF58 family)|nr:MAG: Uncharacterized conserved protein, DUF58 family, contains vWF domain [Verrucomicrobiota bacterium]
MALKRSSPGSGNGEADYLRLLPPELTSTLARLEFLARTKKEGSISGRHASPHKGFSVEFAEHREYAAGDDLRDLDWRVFGRSDRYYIKQYIEETNLRATLIVDASGSMRYTGDCATRLEGKALSKFEYARYMAAALTYLLIRQQDAAGLVTFDTAVRHYRPPASKPSQVRVILEELARTEPGQDTAAASVFHEIAERIPRRGLVLIFSDLFDDPARITEALHHFQFRYHEIVLFHLMAEEEITFPFNKFTDFRSLEIADQQLRVDPTALRSQYLERVRTFIDTIEKACGQMKADYVAVNTKNPLSQTLANYLSGRRESLTR